MKERWMCCNELLFSKEMLSKLLNISEWFRPNQGCGSQVYEEKDMNRDDREKEKLVATIILFRVLTFGKSAF